MKIEAEIFGKDIFEIESPLIGNHQISNICCSLVSSSILNKKGIFKISRNNIIEGIKNVKKNTNIHGRIDLLRQKPSLILDVAHNIDSIKILVETLKNFNFNKIILIFGIMKDKDHKEVIKELSRLVNNCLAVQVEGERALQSDIIVNEFTDFGIRVEKIDNIGTAIKYAFHSAGNNDLILITGSHYVSGKVLKILLEEKWLDI
jgi:dihydrofolate synthase/folylpolyglutamate synthase